MPPRTLPFDAFLDLLRAKGYGVSLHEYSAVAQLLSRWEGVGTSELGDAFAALIGRNDDEVGGIRALFLEIYAPPPPPPTPVAAQPEPLAWLRPRVWALAAAAAVLAAVLVVVFWPPAPEPIEVVPPVIPPVVTPLAIEAVPLPPPPPPDVPPPPTRVLRSVAAGVAGSGFLLGLAGFWLLKIRETRRIWLRHAWASLHATLPGPFDFEAHVRTPAIRLPKTEVEDAATLLGRVYSRKGHARELDIRRTLLATLRRGLMPTLVTKPRRVAEAIVVLCDVCQEMRLWEGKVQAFLSDLRRQGIALQIFYFDGDISRVSERPHRPASPLDVVVRPRPDAPVLIISSGSGLPALFETPDRHWLTLLAHRPRTTWLTPVSDVRLWPECFQAMAVSVWPMTRTGLASAARQLADVDAAFSPLVREQLVREGRVTREDVERMKRLASLAPHPTPALLDSLRLQFAPDVPDAAILHVMNEANGPSGSVVILPDEEIRFNANMMRRESPDLEAAVRTSILRVLMDSEPAAGSAAHERWRIAVENQRLQLADLRGSTPDASAALAALRDLSHGPMGDEVTETLRLVASTAAMRERNASFERGQRDISTLSQDGQRRLRAASPERWAWPGLRELVPAAMAAGVLLLVSLSLNVIPARALEHLTEAYGLAYVAQPSASTPQLQLTLTGAQPGVPTQVDLYREDVVYQSGLSVSAASPTVVQLQAADTGFNYQVRAALPEGNLAISDWVWVRSDRLVFVLVDASPWANVTITGGQTATAAQQTPFTAALLPGTYQLHFSSPALGTQAVFDRALIVQPDGSIQSIHVTMPGFDAGQLVDSLVPSAGATAK